MRSIEMTPFPICTGPCQPCATVLGRDVSLCETCRHMAWMMMPSLAEVSEHYKNVYADTHEQDVLQASVRDYYLNHSAELASYFPERSDLTILDYGCAWPTFLQEAGKTDHYAKLIGVEYDATAREYGQSFGALMLEPGQFDRKIENNSVDILRFSHVIEHLIDPVTALAQLFEKLIPGGLIYITQPIFPVLQKDARPASIQDAVYPKHLHFFSPTSLLNLINRFGFEIERFFAFQNESKVYDLYGDQMDIEYSKDVTGRYADDRYGAISELGAAPIFCGENVVLIARASVKSIQPL